MNIALITFYDKICLGIRQLSSVLRADGHNVWLIFFKGEKVKPIDDYNGTIMYTYLKNGEMHGCYYDVDPYTPQELSLLLELLQDIKPEVIGLSTRSFWSFIAKDIAEGIKRVLPDVPIVAGGYGPSLEPEKFLQFADYVCQGEGEIPMRQLAARIESGEPVAGIANILSKDSAAAAAYNDLIDVNELPFADWAEENKVLIDDDRLYVKNIWNPKWYDIFVSRGCPFSCSYCMAGQFWTKYKETSGCKVAKVRLRSPQHVIEELLVATEHNSSIDYIRFMDSVFGFSKSWVREFLQLYKKYIDRPFFANLDPRIFDPELGRLMVECGLTASVVGIQSTSEEIRARVFNRKVSDGRIIDLANFFNENGVSWQYDIIGWNPFEDEDTLKNGLSLISALPVNAKNIVFKLKFLPESQLGRLHEELRPTPLEDSAYYNYALLYSALLGSHDRSSLLKEAMAGSMLKMQPSELRKLLAS